MSGKRTLPEQKELQVLFWAAILQVERALCRYLHAIIQLTEAVEGRERDASRLGLEVPRFIHFLTEIHNHLNKHMLLYVASWGRNYLSEVMIEMEKSNRKLNILLQQLRMKKEFMVDQKQIEVVLNQLEEYARRKNQLLFAESD